MVKQPLKYNHTCPVLEMRQVYVLTVAKSHLHPALVNMGMRLVSFEDYQGNRLQYREEGDCYKVDIRKKCVYDHQLITAIFVNREII